MKYIAYIIPEFIGDTVILKYACIPYSDSAIRELKRLNAEILGTDLTEEQCSMRALQHSIAIDAMQCPN